LTALNYFSLWKPNQLSFVFCFLFLPLLVAFKYINSVDAVVLYHNNVVLRANYFVCFTSVFVLPRATILKVILYKNEFN